MCGISGFVGDGDIDDLEKMTDALAHRGPDARGFWSDRKMGVFLGHRRLAIIDLKDGDQPMVSGNLVVVFNGEIYNHERLRKILEARGHVFFTDHSDTEVLLHGYREWGCDLPEKLNGMWAFVIFDRAEKKMFLSRDRFGKKPLFYSLQHHTFAFASELNALEYHPSIETTSPSSFVLDQSQA